MARIPDHSDHNAMETSRSEENPERCKNTLRFILKLPNHLEHGADKSTNLSIADEQTKECKPSELKPVHVTLENAREEEASIKEPPNVEAKEIDSMHPCTLCDKFFRSLKALHGHMRIHNKAHPNKEMKEDNNKEEVTTTLNQICNPNIPGNEVLKWKTKGKRTLQENPPTPIDDPDVLEGSRDLMYLYNGGKESNTREIEAEKTETRATPTTESTVKPSTDTNQDDENNDELEAKKMKLDESRAYVCGACKKSFASHQALGGHATSHNKEKNKKGEGDENGLNKDRKKSGDGDEKKHVCEICSMVFATGQALGGHMRKHFDPTKLKKPKREAEQVEDVSEDTGGNLDELQLVNAMEEANQVQVQTVNEENGRAFGDLQNVNEETDNNSGESRSAGNLTGLPHVFDLNELALMCDEEMQDLGV